MHYLVLEHCLFLQDTSEGSQTSVQDDSSSSQADQNTLRIDAKYNYENSMNGQVLGNYLNVHIHQLEEPQVLKLYMIFIIIYFTFVD